MAHPLPLLIPLAAALLYAFAALTLKRATERGIGPWRVSFVANWVSAAIFAPFWLAGGHAFTAANLLHAIIVGGVFFSGQVCTFLALARGDVSVVTPVLGTKVIFVALFATVFAAEPLTGTMWLAALLTSVATALFGGVGRPQTQARPRGLLFGFASATSFALTDVLVQKWAPAWGFGHFAPVMFLTVAVLSCGLIPLFRADIRELPWRWVLPGSALLALQAVGVAYAIIAFGSATTTNVIYNSRGLWSVVLVWSVGHWFANVEREQGRGVLFRRLIASAILLAAIILIAQRQAH